MMGHEVDMGCDPFPFPLPQSFFTQYFQDCKLGGVNMLKVQASLCYIIECVSGITVCNRHYLQLISV